ARYRLSLPTRRSSDLGMAASLAAFASGLAKLPRQPLSFDQHVIWISVALLPLLAQSSKACPVILLPAVQGFDKLEIDASAGFLRSEEHTYELQSRVDL